MSIGWGIQGCPDRSQVIFKTGTVRGSPGATWSCRGYNCHNLMYCNSKSVFRTSTFI